MDGFGIAGILVYLILPIIAFVLAVTWTFLPFLLLSRLGKIQEAIETLHKDIRKATDTDKQPYGRLASLHHLDKLANLDKLDKLQGTLEGFKESYEATLEPMQDYMNGMLRK